MRTIGRLTGRSRSSEKLASSARTFFSSTWEIRFCILCNSVLWTQRIVNVGTCPQFPLGARDATEIQSVPAFSPATTLQEIQSQLKGIFTPRSQPLTECKESFSQ